MSTRTPLSGPPVWTGDEIKSSSRWIRDLTPEQIDELDAAVKGLRGMKWSEITREDVWFPTLAPSVETMKLGQAAETEADWQTFAKKYRAEMAAPGAQHALALLAALSAQANFSVGCYCEDEARCHRSLLRSLLAGKGAKVR